MIESERYVIGALLKNHNLIHVCTLDAKDFSDSDLCLAFHAITRLSGSGFDVITVADHLQQTTKREWLAYLGEIVHGMFSVAMFETHCQAVKEKSRKRHSVELAQKIIDSNGDQDCIDVAMQEFSNVPAESKPTDLQTLLDISVGNLADTNKSIGVYTGLHDLDKRVCGFREQELVIIGARPSIGKTALLKDIAYGCNVPTLFISAEQSAEQITNRFIITHSRVGSHKFRTRRFDGDDWERIQNSKEFLKTKQIYIDDKAGPTIEEVARKARYYKAKYGIQMLCVDYLQKLQTAQRMEIRPRVMAISEGLKNIAKELNIPVVSLAQLNRGCEKREDKRPVMSDLNESGSIEQDADIIMFLYRDEYYNEDTPEKGIAEIDIAKSRDGPTGVIKLSYQGQFMSFGDLYVNFDKEPGSVPAYG